MAAVSQTIPNLLGGVSQQPDPIKLPGQVREAENTYLDPTFGCKKRPPTEFVAKLANNVPSNAKWFPIFRDNEERYVVALYRTTTTVLRVWDAKTGVERTVTIGSGADAYLQTNDLDDISHLTLADYTLIANKSRIVSMNSVQLSNKKKEALVQINSVAYNTQYSVDLSRDGTASSQVQVYSATALEVVPGSYEVADGGVCTQNSAQDHSVTQGSKTGLQFRIVNQCSAYYDAATNAYRSRYNTSVILKNGGTGWRVGDTVSVTQAGKSFTVRVSEEKFVYTFASDGIASYVTASNASSGTLTVTDIITNLSNAINAISGYTTSFIGNVIKIQRTDTRDFNISVRGGVTNQAMTVLKGSAADIADLPSQCFPDFELKVRNTAESDADDYYVKFVPDAPGIPGAGSWEETHEDGIETSINPSTMPHALIRLSNGNFELKALDSSSAFGGWASREVGDETSNPKPSFVGRGVSGLTFFANRLGFLSDDAIIFSQPGDYFNFFSTSAVTISDSDPIDLTASASKPAFLKSAVTTPKGLLLFSENNQFLMRSEEVAFAPATVKLTEIAAYTMRGSTQPVSTGLSIVFASEADTYSKVFEMAVDSVQNRPQIADLTQIIPEYIPPDLTWVANSPNNSIVYFGDDSSTVYVFKFFNQGNERQVAGWSKWKFPSEVRMWGADDDTNYIVTYDGTNSILLKMELLDDSTAPVNAGFTKFLPRLDHLQKKASLTTSVSGSNTRINFSDGSYVANTQPVFIVTSGTSQATFLRPTIQGTTTKYIEVPTTLVGFDYMIGLQYEMKITLPSFFVTQQDRADRVDIPIIENLYLDLYKSGSYDIDISKDGYADTSFEVSTFTAGQYLSNSVPLVEVDTQPVPIFCMGDQVTCSVRAEDPMPAALTSYSWQGHFNKRAIATLR